MAHLIKNVLAQCIKYPNTWKINLLKQWSRIMGDLQAKVTLEKIGDDYLVLGVGNSCWMHELYLLSSMLLTTINNHLDQPRIKKIRFKQIGFSKKRTRQLPREKHTKKSVPDLSRDESLALNRVKDPELKKVLAAFRSRCYQERA